MGWTLATLGSLVLSVALAAAASAPAHAARVLVPTAATQSRAAPLQRVLVAVPDAGALPGTLTVAALTTRLHLADPAATVVVMVSGDAARTIGWFHITIVPPAVPGDPTTTVRIRVDGEGSLVAPLRPVAADAPSPAQATVVEALGGAAGIMAGRIGELTLTPDEVRMPTWHLPGIGVDAVALDGAWWSLGPDHLDGDPSARAALGRLRGRLGHAPVSAMRRLVDVSVGDVTGDGAPDLALSFRRPFRRTLLNAPLPRRFWTDADGLSAHVGLYRTSDLSEIWVAGTLVRPVRRLAACTGGLAVAYSTLRRPTIVATSVWRWQGFGFLPLPELPGRGTPTCIDIDRDGRPEAAIIERS